MQTKTANKGPFHIHWRKLLAGVLTAVLLLPLPAFATLTFTDAWSFDTKTTGGAPTPTFSFTDAANFYTLDVDMKQFDSPNGATSTFTALRSFSMADNETLHITHQFQTFLSRAGFDVQIQISRIAGGTQFPIGPVSFQAKNNEPGIIVSAGQPGAPSSYMQAMGNADRYRLSITIKYTKSANGGWSNTPHQFTFFGT